MVSFIYAMLFLLVNKQMLGPTRICRWRIRHSKPPCNALGLGAYGHECCSP